jgi:hypothetical protein
MNLEVTEKLANCLRRMEANERIIIEKNNAKWTLTISRSHRNI